MIVDTLVRLLGISAQDPAFWMPLLFMGLLFGAIVAAAVLDGFDIGVGCLTLVAPAPLRPRMMALLGPWRDANEYWLFLGMGVFAAAFPKAWGAVMGPLYLPLCLLALGVVLRSVAFEFRLRAPLDMQPRWVRAFGVGSVFTAAAHGLLLSQIVVGDPAHGGYFAFCLFLAVCCVAAYALLGATWLIMREQGALRIRAVFWGRRAVRWTAAGAVGVSVVLVFANTGVFLKWSEGPSWFVVAALWASMLLAFVVIEITLQRMINHSDRATGLPFIMALVIFLILLGGLGYSFFPYLVLDDITIWDGAASVDALRLILAATIVALPVVVIFNVWVYWYMFGLSRPRLPGKYKGT